MKEAGIDLSITYQNDLLGNPIGGKNRGFAHADSWGVNLLLDLEHIAKIKGLSFFTSFVFRTGTNLSQTRIDNQFPVAQLFGSETYRLNELYLQETLFDGSFVTKAGRLNAGNDFLKSPLYCQFVNNAFCGNPISIFFNTFVYFTAYPVATWGAYLEFKPYRCVDMKFAIYNTDKNGIVNSRHGASLTFRSSLGSFLITEWAYLNNQDSGSRGLPGNYKLGWWYLSGEKQKFEGGCQKGDYGYYILVDQMIYRKGSPGSLQGITPFIALLFSPENRNKFPFFMTAALTYRGIVSSRPDDIMSFGVGHGSYSSDLRKVQRLAKKTSIVQEASCRGSSRKSHHLIVNQFGDQPETSETVLELNYMFQVNKWLQLTPDVQYIINPKGYGTIQNPLVVGVELSVNL